MVTGRPPPACSGHVGHLVPLVAGSRWVQNPFARDEGLGQCVVLLSWRPFAYTWTFWKNIGLHRTSKDRTFPVVACPWLLHPIARQQRDFFPCLWLWCCLVGLPQGGWGPSGLGQGVHGSICPLLALSTLVCSLQRERSCCVHLCVDHSHKLHHSVLWNSCLFLACFFWGEMHEVNRAELWAVCPAAGACRGNRATQHAWCTAPVGEIAV